MKKSGKYFYIVALVCFCRVAEADFNLVANHPEAQAYYPEESDIPEDQLSSRGRWIKVLRRYRNRVYIGFGQDDGKTIYDNYLPLPIRYLSDSGQLSEPQGELRSQEMDAMEVLQGKLFIPAVDYEGDEYAECSEYYCEGALFNTPELAHHVYQAVEYSGSIYMVGGSSAPNGDCKGTLWKSSDDGLSWSIEMQMFKDNTYPGCARFSVIGGVAGKLFLQGYQYDYGGEICSSEVSTCNWRVRPEIYIFDGTQWVISTSVPMLTPRLVSRTVNFKDKLILFSSSSTISSFDGTNNQVVESSVVDFTVDGDWTYILKQNGDIQRSKDLQSWRTVLTGAPVDSVSMETLNNSVYVGTKQGKIYKDTIPEQKAFSFIKYKNYLIPINAE